MHVYLHTGLTGASVELVPGMKSAIGQGLAMYRDARDESRRQAAIAEITKRIRENQPAELATSLISSFDASGYSAEFDFGKPIAHYWRCKLYQFLFTRVGEEFADIVLAKKDKFESFQVQVTLADVFVRAAAALRVNVGDGSALVTDFQNWLDEDEVRYLNGRNVGDPSAVSRVVKESEFRGRKYKLYANGSVEAQTIAGMKMFPSMEAMQDFLS
jgi:hypothetical protein